MKRPVAKKKLCMAIASLLLSLQLLLPTAVLAGTELLDYNNPNSNGDNPYRISLKGVVSSGLLMNVLGCTGIVNKVSKVSTEFIENLVKSKADRIALKAKQKTAKLITVPSTDSISSDQILTAQQKQANDDAAVAFREECLNGIAITLARNQLTAMTRDTMTWINTGFSGDPFFVRNVNTFMDDITNNILQKETDLFRDPANKADYPYGRNFARDQINATKAASNFKDSVKQDLTNYLTPGSTPESFATDFSQGGWSGWLALTQHPQNNPGGFAMINAQNIAQQQETAVANQKAELVQNGGYLSQKVCKVFGLTKQNATKKLEDLKNKALAAKARADAAKVAADKAQADAKKAREAVKNATDEAAAGAFADQAEANARIVLARLDAAIADVVAANALVVSAGANTALTADPNKDCAEWETVTPGSAIRDKVSTYLNSPERQLELARTINDVLNALFSALINKFENQGLSSLSPSKNVPTGRGVLTIDPITGLPISNPTAGGFTAGNGYFDLIRDLGGVIKNQNTYVSKINESMSIIQNVVPTLGKLDYCIPGPNQNWKQNSQDAIDAYIENTSSESSPFDVSGFDSTISDYSTKLETVYGTNSPMQDPRIGNTSYLEMAQEGLRLTQNLQLDAESITAAQEDSKKILSETKTNIAKLNKIKESVNAIISAAQKRRAAERAKDGLPIIKASCLAGEMIQ